MIAIEQKDQRFKAGQRFKVGSDSFLFKNSNHFKNGTNDKRNRFSILTTGVHIKLGFILIDRHTNLSIKSQVLSETLFSSMKSIYLRFPAEIRILTVKPSILSWQLRLVSFELG